MTDIDSFIVDRIARGGSLHHALQDAGLRPADLPDLMERTSFQRSINAGLLMLSLNTLALLYSHGIHGDLNAARGLLSILSPLRWAGQLETTDQLEDDIRRQKTMIDELFASDDEES